jgi:hypothetical protein
MQVNNREPELRPFNWRPQRPGTDHMRVFGGWWSQIPNRSPLLELSLHAKVQLARENVERCREDIEEALRKYLISREN